MRLKWSCLVAEVKRPVQVCKRGLAALLAMLNSCAPGIAVVNIDNGFGAAFAAHRVNVQVARARARKTVTRAASRQ